MCGFPGAYYFIKAFSEIDCTEDLRKFDIPTLNLHGDDDQIAPIDDSARLSAKLIKGAHVKVFPGAPHGICSTSKDEINTDLLAFFRRGHMIKRGPPTADRLFPLHIDMRS